MPESWFIIVLDTLSKAPVTATGVPW